MDNPKTENPWTEIFNKHRENRLLANNKTLKDRLRSLESLEKSLHQHRTAFHQALHKDFRKSEQETDITELYPVLHEIRHAKANLRNWMRPQVVDNPLSFYGTKSKVIRISKGTCLLISPWNYPLLLTFGPLIGALAGGNTIIIKPSEYTPHTSSLMKEIIRENFSDDEVIVVEGDKKTAEQLLELPFDHICFTGSPQVGKHVMHAASEHLSSLTLELGGKTPVYIHSDANIPDAAEKITAAKLNNAGQSCVSPDFILVHHQLMQTLIPELEKAFKIYYNQDDKIPGHNFASIINSANFERLEKISSFHQQPNHGGDNLVFEPVIIKDATIDDASMKQEIFGPVLPIISVLNQTEAIKIIHDFPTPLSIYVFTKENKIKDYFIKNTRSGSICFNDCAIQFLHPGLPFGGIGNSGMGRLHGQSGFNAFTQERVVFKQRIGLTTAKVLYPPYNTIKKKIIDLMLKYF